MSVQPIDATLRLGVDLTMLKQEVAETVETAEEAEFEIAKAINSSLGTVRSAIQMTSLFISASGTAVDQTLLSIAESIVLAAEAITGIAAAESLTLVGVFTAGIKLAAAGALLLQVNAINRGRTEAAARFMSLSGGLRGLSTIL